MTAPLTVLVVDDDHRARTALVRALDDCPGLRAVGLDQEQAARLADAGGALADAVVLDVPRATSVSLRAVASLSTVAPVLVTSLSGAVADATRAAGAAAFVEKDGDGDALVDRIALHVRTSVEHNARVRDRDEEVGP